MKKKTPKNPTDATGAADRPDAINPAATTQTFIGLMSGTSADAVDAALIEVRGQLAPENIQYIGHHRLRWPPKLRAAILAAMAPARVSAADVAMLNVRIAQQFARAAITLLTVLKRPAAGITAIGSHGQTIAHQPPQANRPGATLQLGDVSVIATLTGITTVGNFRPADMALGGQGAPLVPAVDQLLFSHRRRCRSVHNIGGISNLTFIPALRDRDSARLIAFDTGPGNCLMDSLAQRLLGQPCDRSGRLAAAGAVDHKLLARLLRHPYFRQVPPKSTGREIFGMPLAQRLIAEYPVASKSLFATAAELTAISIARAYQNFLPQPPDEIIFCGGGVNNPFLMSRIEHHLRLFCAADIGSIADYGMANPAREAICFALLAAMTLRHLPGNIPSCTGAARPAILGVVSHPS